MLSQWDSLSMSLLATHWVDHMEADYSHFSTTQEHLKREPVHSLFLHVWLAQKTVTPLERVSYVETVMLWMDLQSELLLVFSLDSVSDLLLDSVLQRKQYYKVLHVIFQITKDTKFLHMILKLISLIAVGKYKTIFVTCLD